MSETEPSRRSWPRRLLNRLEVDRAVFYALLVRGWQLPAGLVSLLLMVTFFTPDLQGYYYTFFSVLALRSFFELSFHVVLLNVASHEWAQLQLDENGCITGDADALSRLVSLGRTVLRRYAMAAVLFVVVAGTAGVLFFRLKPVAGIDWLQPWIALVMVTGCSLITYPFVALLEGCHQVVTVNKFRLLQAILANLAVWTCLPLGAKLWTTVAMASAQLGCDLWLVAVRYRRFFRPFFSLRLTAQMNWRSEVWPMQWRLAIQSIFGYFAFCLFNPVMWYYHSPAVAGQMGMTWTLLTALQGGALSWVQTRAPRLGVLVSNKDYRELDRIFFRVSYVSFGLLAAASLALWTGVFALNQFDHRWANRLLEPLPTAIFLIAVLLLHITHYQCIYVWAHKREPFVVASTVSSLLIALLVWQLGSRYAANGAACGYLAVIALFNLPAWTRIWNRCRTEWHQDETQ